ncbi:hypothetical protein L7F22_044431 [Adiantum nelumboides]|nr:hypothetical protein [Adiantum nelumboides]
METFQQLTKHPKIQELLQASKSPTQTQKASSQSLQCSRQSRSGHLQRKETSKEQRSNDTRGKGHVVEQPLASIGHMQPSTHGLVNGQDSNEQTMRQTIPLPLSNAGCFGGGSVFQAMIRPSPALHGFMPDNAYGAMPLGGSNPMYGNIGVQPGKPGVNLGLRMPLLRNAPAYDNLTPKGKPKDYKEGGLAVKFDTFHGTHDKLKAMLFLQQFDAAFARGNFTEASKIRKAATFLKTNALQWWNALLNQGVIPSTWVQFKQIIAPAWITNTFEVDVMTAWNQLSAINCESLEEYNAKFWDALLPESSFKMVPLAEQIEKYCCGLPKGIKKYCTKTSVMNMAQLMENAEVADDLIQGKPDEDGLKTRCKESQGKQFSVKDNITSRLTVPPFKKKPFAGSISPMVTALMWVVCGLKQWQRFSSMPFLDMVKAETGVAGERLYEKARRGEHLDVPARKVAVYDFLVSRSKEDRQELEFFVRCSKGTYIRSLCADFARALKSCAHLTSLRRDKIGELSVNDAWTMEGLEETYTRLYRRSPQQSS